VSLPLSQRLIATAPVPSRTRRRFSTCSSIAPSSSLAAAGGQLAEVGRNGGIGLFGEKTSENPVRRAIRFADALFSRKMCRAAAVDLASVAVRRKPDGGERYVRRLQKIQDMERAMTNA